jgi:hypothetical protein
MTTTLPPIQEDKPAEDLAFAKDSDEEFSSGNSSLRYDDDEEREEEKEEIEAASKGTMRWEHRPRKLTSETERQSSTLSSSCTSSLAPHPDNSVDDVDDDDPPTQKKTIPAWSRGWTRAVLCTHVPILYVLQCISSTAAHYPRCTITGTTILSVGLLVTGLLTNFTLQVGRQFSPKGSAPVQHSDWVGQTFGDNINLFNVILYNADDGDLWLLEQQDMDEQPQNYLPETTKMTSLLGSELVRRAFQVMDVVSNVPGYRELCSNQEVLTYVNPMTGEIDCEVYAVTRYWGNNRTWFEETAAISEEAVVAILSKNFFADGTPVSRQHLFGSTNSLGSTTSSTSATNVTSVVRSSLVVFMLPSISETRRIERRALSAMLRLRQQWREDNDDAVEDFDNSNGSINVPMIHLEVQSSTSLSDEFTRAIADDVPLVPTVFIVMSLFTAASFARWSWSSSSRRRTDVSPSRALLGLGAVVVVLLSIAAAFGMMFIHGTPFSSLTQILPFIILYVFAGCVWLVGCRHHY